jgi:hypothetical protein
MSTPLIKYPLDLTGTSPNNLVTGETQSLAAATNRAFVPNSGPFFTRSLVVRSMPSGTILTPETQYKAVQLFVDATLRAGAEICSVIVITDDSLGNDYSIDYQVLGGEFSDSTYAIEQMIAALQIDDRAVKWGDILGKPEEFAPAPHLHDLGDLYGFEYITVALEQLRQAILTGDDASHAAIYQYVDHQDGLIRTDLDQTEADLSAHLADRNNPHQTTSAQVGLGLVQNYGVASLADAKAGTRNDLYMTPANTAAAITQQAGTLLQQHINDHTNPHATTATQVGLGLVQNYAVATTVEAQAGASDTVYMTSLKTAQAINTQAVTPLNAHIARLDNPHATTAAQVGLGNVQNFGLAATADAQAGTSNVLYMTPALTAAAVTSQVGNALNAHINNANNPHATTKAQVGLGSVDNTADINKPVSNPQQAALNNKASIGDTVRFAQVGIGSDFDCLIYESNTNEMSVRAGPSNSYRYYTFGANGNFTVGSGSVISAGGFQPSDKRLKKHIRSKRARALWREVEHKRWNWKDDGRLETGVIAQEVQVVAPEYVKKFDYEGRKGVLGVDKAGMGFEMAMAAGAEIDVLFKAFQDQSEVISRLEREVAKLKKKG